MRVDPTESYAAKCVRVNDAVLVPAGYPKLEQALRDLGSAVPPLEMSEFEKDGRRHLLPVSAFL